MMELLPPVGWADVATKRDLDQQREVTNLRFDQVDQRFHQTDQRFHQTDQRFHQVDQRFDQVGDRFRQVGDRFDALEKGIGDRIDESASKLRAEIAGSERRLLTILLPVIVAGIAFLAALSAWGPG